MITRLHHHAETSPAASFMTGRSGSSDLPARAVAQGPLSSHTSAIFSRLDCLGERFTTTFAVIDMQFRQNPEAANNSHWKHQSRTIRTGWRTAVHDSPRRAGTRHRIEWDFSSMRPLSHVHRVGVTRTDASGSQRSNQDCGLMRRNQHSMQDDFWVWRLLLHAPRVEDRHLKRAYRKTGDFKLW